MVDIVGYSGIPYHSEFAASYAASMSLSPSDGGFQTFQLSGSPTMDISAGTFNGQQIKVRITGDPISNFTVTWGTNIRASASTFTVNATKRVTFIFSYYGTKWELINTPLSL